MIVSDPLRNLYLSSAEARIRTAYRPGTRNNHKYILSGFIAVAIRFGLDYRTPSVILWILYIEHLARNQKTAAAVASTISSLRAILSRLSIPLTEINAYFVQALQRSISINKRTVTFQRPPITPDHIKRIFQAVGNVKYAPHFRSAVLLMFATAMRQSNLFPRTQRSFDPHRMLLRKDVSTSPTGVVIRNKWSKSQQTVASLRYQSVPTASNHRLCLRHALNTQLAACTHTASNLPLFHFDDGKPITLSFILKLWTYALRRAGLSSLYTLHSLRRGGATYLQTSGVPMPELASHGGWRSAAVLRYTRDPNAQSTAQALRRLA